MANNELPKAQLGKIIGSIIKGGYQGAQTGYKTYKAASLAEKAAKLKKAQAAARTQKAAATRAANAKAANAAKNSKPSTTKTSTTNTTKTKTPATPKGKEPFVKSKARLATENITGKVIGGFPFYTINATGKVLKNPIAQGILGTAGTLAVANRYKKTNAPKKVKNYKKK
jgi:hypothetical protein